MDFNIRTLGVSLAPQAYSPPRPSLGKMATPPSGGDGAVAVLGMGGVIWDLGLGELINNRCYL